MVGRGNWGGDAWAYEEGADVGRFDPGAPAEGLGWRHGGGAGGGDGGEILWMLIDKVLVGGSYDQGNIFWLRLSVSERFDLTSCCEVIADL